MRTRTIHLLLLAASLLIAPTAAPVSAGEEARQAVAPSTPAAAAPAPAGCGADLDLARLAAPTPAVSPVPAPESTVPGFITLAGRTCRCSCGFPCKRDSDCGPGGRCTAGITCC